MSNPLEIIYIDTEKSPRNSLVRSDFVTPTQLNSFIAGDKIGMAIVFVNQSSIDTRISGDSTYTITAAIGNYTSGILTSTSNFYASTSYGFTGSIDLSVGALTNSLSNLEYINSIFEIQATDSNGNKRTYLQSPVVIWNQVII